MLQIVMNVLTKLFGSLLKGGGIHMDVYFGGLEGDVSHGVGQNGKQGIDIFVPLAP